MTVVRKRRIFLLDSHDIYRMGLRQALEERDSFAVVGEAGDVTDGFDQIARARPDVVVVGVREHETGMMDTLAALSAAQPQTRVLVLSRTARETERRAVLGSGARGYLSKDVHAEELAEAVDTIAAGAPAPDFERHQQRRRPRRAMPPGVSELTRQERVVLDLIGHGHSNHQIAAELFLAEKTVRNHVTRVLAKLGVQRRTQAALIAVELRDR